MKQIDNARLELFWNDIPLGKENAITYPSLIAKWGINERQVRYILHELSSYDNGDDYILVRSSNGKGFYKTDDAKTIEAFKQECLHRGRSVFAPIRKINRVQKNNTEQYSITNNMRVIREAKGIKQTEVCEYMQQFDIAIDVPMLSKFENAVCLPTPYQLSKLAEFYECDQEKLVNIYSYY